MGNKGKKHLYSCSKDREIVQTSTYIIDGCFLPRLLFNVTWKVNIFIILQASFLISYATHFTLRAHKRQSGRSHCLYTSIKWFKIYFIFIHNCLIYDVEFGYNLPILVCAVHFGVGKSFIQLCVCSVSAIPAAVGL